MQGTRSTGGGTAHLNMRQQGLPTVQSVEADFPLAAPAPMSSSPPPPPMSSDADAVLRSKWCEVTVGLVALGIVVLAM